MSVRVQVPSSVQIKSRNESFGFFLFTAMSKACFNECKEIKNKLRSSVGFFQNVDSGTQHS